MSAFKIGDTIHYMENNKPTSNEVKGIATIQGEVKIGYTEHTIKETEYKVLYVVGYGTFIESKDAFLNPEALKEELFNNL